MSEHKKFVRADEAVPESNDWTRNEWLCRPDFVALKDLLMLKATMQPGHCHPFHRHPHREEILHIISGRAEQWVGEEHRILGPGDVANIRAGEVHATYNPFDEPLVFHAILSPGVLESPLDEAPDPQDVSDEESWKSLRAGMTPCRVLAV
jgi:quercetin dioxygenase-like cupin family protein